MTRSLRLAALVLLALAPATARANGRFPGATNIHGKPGDGQNMLMSTTFGLLLSGDGGTTWNWVCETAIGYGGEYDPDYTIHPTTGDIWATTFEGLRVSRDGGCTFQEIGGPLGPYPGMPTQRPWIGEVEVGPDGRVWAATSTGDHPNDVFVSSNGTDFTSVGLLETSIWWESLRVAPSDANRVYVSGYQVAPTMQAVVRRSINGGTGWDVMPTTGITFGSQPQLMIMGVAPNNPDIVFARVLNANQPTGDALYRSDDGAASWKKVLDMPSTITAFVIRQNGNDVFAASSTICNGDPVNVAKGCWFRSTNGGVDFSRLTVEPKAGVTPTPSTSNCLFEGGDGALYACGSNWEPDNFALAKSTDNGDTWTKVFRFQDVAGPKTCPKGTSQHDECAALIWPSLCVQIGICPGAPDAAVVGGTDAGKPGGGGKGCGGCDVSLAALLIVPWRRRKRRS